MSYQNTPRLAHAKLSNKVGFNTPNLLDPTLFDNLAAHCERRLSNIFCLIKCWIEFAFDQTLRPKIRLNATMFSVLPLFQQSCVQLANHGSLSYFQAQPPSIIVNKDGGRGPKGRRGLSAGLIALFGDVWFNSI